MMKIHNPCAGIIRIRFEGYNLSLSGTPLFQCKSTKLKSICLDFNCFSKFRK